MRNLIPILTILCSNYLGAHVITDNIGRTMKCDRYDDEQLFSEPDHDQLTSVDFDPDIEVCESDGNGKSFCFTLWKNDSDIVEVKKKGCFQNENNCGHTCISIEKRKGLFFCCCEGDLCNKNFYFEPTPYSESDTENLGSDLPPVPQILVILAFIISCLLIVLYAQKRGKYPCIGEKARNSLVTRHLPAVEESDKLRPIELLEIKAQGRFGIVWRAKCKSDYVAVKILPAEYRELWLTEQEIFKLPNMDHENILHFFGAEERGNNIQKEYWIITAYQELGSLHDYLKFNTVNWEELCIISFTMTRGLAHLHEEILNEKSDIFKPSIAHRDFKSTNVLLKNDLSACIADFGFAFPFRSQICHSRHEKIGTKRYMAPEILEGAVGFSNHSFLCMDMYACGLVLWEILSRCSIHEDAKNGYKLPYEDELGELLSFETFQDYVVSKKGRPSLKETWKNNPLLSNVCEIIEECWDPDADARLSAACVTERFSWYLRSAVKSETKLLYSIV